MSKEYISVEEFEALSEEQKKKYMINDSIVDKDGEYVYRQINVISMEEYNLLSEEEKKLYKVDTIGKKEYDSLPDEHKKLCEPTSIIKMNQKKLSMHAAVKLLKDSTKKEEVFEEPQETWEEKKVKIVTECLTSCFDRLKVLSKDLDNVQQCSILMSMASSMMITYVSTMKEFFTIPGDETNYKYLPKEHHEDITHTINVIAERGHHIIKPTQDLLIVIHSEEIPAKMQKQALIDGTKTLTKVLKQFGLYFDSVDAAKEHLKKHEGK